MRILFHVIFAGLMALSGPVFAQDQALHFTMDSKVLTPPPGMQTIGDSHGDIAVSPAGEIYVSVQGGDHPGIQVYSADGHYLRNVPDAPPDLHGFIIARGPDRKPYIFGVSRLAQQIVRIGLDATPPSVWKEGLFYEPYGITYDAKGNLPVTEFNQWGRVSRLTRQ